ncbi:hypothetical protein F8M41_010598 [Gigaspora margarita]|uniref:Uncharacterized protein n=1 Tax=Gigaspora margarita TaxID=4874 RepID=A0A8H4EUW2_GIGMA|nr:hypothetical protein F8M41_010598 [Gigaspora margarita]
MSQIPTGGNVHSNEEILMFNQVKAADHSQLVAFVIMLFGAYNDGLTTPNEPMIISGDTLHYSPDGCGAKIFPDVAIIPNKNHIPDPTVPHPGPPPSDVSWDFGTIPENTVNVPGHTIPTTGCTGPGLTNYTAKILIREIFYNPTNPVPAVYTPVIPAALNIDPDASIDIDLYLIQQRVLSMQKQ